jgi:hypothetical protein
VPLDAIRLEWAPAPVATGGPAPAEESAPLAPPAPVASTPPPVAEARPAAVPLPAAAPPSPLPAPVPAAPAPEPLLSPTLAELYFGQGAFDQAIQAYEQLMLREPANERYRARLAEIRRSAPPPPPADEERAARRRVIEGQIMRLERLLALVKRA